MIRIEISNASRMAFIDAEMAKRSIKTESVPTNLMGLPSIEDDVNPNLHNSVQRQPATTGALQEIDLGPTAREAAVLASDVAQRRIRGEEPPVPLQSKPSGKPRLGPDGKPWRTRRRRNSADVARDALVEAFLSENRIEMYDEADLRRQQLQEQSVAGDGEADEQIAEQFRREFLDAAQERRDRVPPPGGKVEKGEEKKGPKLGGSRSARAKIREAEMAAARVVK